VLQKIPSWILRWGITLIFCILAILLVGSYFFRYPEIVTAPIVVTTENLPVNIVAKSSGRIDTLYVTEKQQVSKNQILGVMENSASTMAMLDLIAFTDTFNINTNPYPLGEEAGVEVSKNFGDVQPAFSAFKKSSEDLRFFLETNYHNNKIKVLEKQIAVQETLLSQSYRQLKLIEEQSDAANKVFAADSVLFSKNVLSSIDFENAKAARLQARQSIETAKSDIENRKIGILQSEQAIFDLRQQQSEQFSQLTLQYVNAFDQLKAQLKSWEQLYLLRSQIDGTATYTKYWQKNQHVTAGETVLSIVPDGNRRIIGKIYLPPQGAGKVKEGRTVNVKFDNFPYMEYGMVKVKINKIALVPITENSQRTYVLEVDFHDELTTTYNKTLTFSQEMSGTAEIITEDLSLLERLLNPVRLLAKR
ncbi:MAG: HlyD family secretion protein, partial [Dysgonamonadaceae bacterium]|nr:HlyD family secretion protein [Dysgonamonadaceae bacterium]